MLWDEMNFALQLVGYTTDREFMTLLRHVTLPRRFLFGYLYYTPGRKLENSICDQRHGLPLMP